MLTFPTLGAVFTLKELKFLKSNFILTILAYSGFSTCPEILNFHPVLRKLAFPQEMMLVTSR